MKIFRQLSFLILLSFTLSAQNSNSKLTDALNYKSSQIEANESILVWVFFKDKGNSVSEYMSNPSSVVSEKSLKRRMKVMPADRLIDNSDLPVNQNYINQLNSIGVEVKQKSKWFNGISAFVNQSQIKAISQLSIVKQIDIVYQFKKNYPENLEASSNQLNSQQPESVTSLDYGNSFTQVNQINVIPLHDLGVNGQGITIAVMDAGFNLLAHHAFDNMNIIAAWDFVNNDPDVGDGNDMGTGSHGTQTLSTIGGYSPGNLIGPAFGADFILAKTENNESETPIEEDNWIAALEWADSIGVDVTSTSLGYVDFDYPYTSYTWASMDGNTCRITIAADLAVGKGIVVVNSAGNEGSNSTHNTLVAPSDGDSVLAIGGVSSSGTRVSFSSVGNTVDGRIKPDLMAMGSGVVVASPYSATSFTTASGTSFSCPLAAGAAALLLSLNPALTPMEVGNLLKNTASNSATPNREYGWGIINLFAAVQASGGNDSTPPETITDLQTFDAATNSLSLQWTVPIDSSLGGVMEFDVRYSTSPINDLTAFNNASPLNYTDRPGAAGTTVAITKNNLTANTEYYFSIRSRDIWNNWSDISNNASGITLYNPDINVTPISITHLIEPGDSKIDSIIIANVSNNLSTLDYSIELTNNTFPTGSISASIKPVKNYSLETIDKQKGLENFSFGQFTEGFGGPDNFGYEWIDSDEPNGPNYDWVDISTSGTQVVNWIATGSFNALDEGYAGPFNLGFDFKYYGEVKNQIYLSSNGFAAFSPLTTSSFTNDPIPTSDVPNGIISPLWDDLDGGSTGTVYYQTIDNKFYIQYNNWPRYSGGGEYTFQIVLYPGGKIMFYYKSLTGSLTSSTVGIENADGSDGLQVAYNADYLQNNFAVQIAAEPEWITPDHFNGRLYNGNSASLLLNFITADLPMGDYSMDIEISCNDPDEGLITIPVNMSVTNDVPVELQSFTVSVIGGNVQLNWKTATEVNNKGFAVERQSESNWGEIAFINGKGTSTEINEYSFTDVELSSGNYKYRLKQIDFDGSFAYSNVVEISFMKSPTEFTLMQNYPNPFNPITKINFVIPSGVEGVTTLKVFDILSNHLATLVNETKEPGTYEVEFDGSNLPSGIYFYRLSAGSSTDTKKLILLK